MMSSFFDMSRLKIPRTRRDHYRILKYLEESGSDNDSCNSFETAGRHPDEGYRYELAEMQTTTNNTNNQSNQEDEGMKPLVAPLRYKNKYKERPDYPTFNSNGTEFRKGEGDFVDMPATREYMELQKEGLSTPTSPTNDDLDSPVKPVLNETLHEQQKGRKTTKKLSGKQFSRDYVDNELGKAAFTYFDIIFYMVSIGSYLADVSSDCWVAYMYYTGGHWMWFSLTVAFITVPSIVMTTFSLKWYIIDHKHDKKNNRKTASVVRWVSRFMFLMLQLSPMLRYIDSLIYGCKSRRYKNPTDHKQKLHWYHMMLYEDTDSCLLRLIECFMEAAPQLVLQLYIMCVLGAEDGIIVLIGQALAALTSLCSLAWSLTAYHKALRASLPTKKKMTYTGMFLQFFWRFFIVAARVIALALFAARFKAWVFVVIASHWMTMFFWIRFMETKFCDTRAEELGFNLVTAAIYIFCFLNLVEGHTRLRYLFYYIITFIEDAALITTWYLLTQTKYIWYQNPAICAVFLGYVIGIIFQAIYYLKVHPNNLVVNSDGPDQKNPIRLWIPIKELLSPSANLTNNQKHGDVESQEPTAVKGTNFTTEAIQSRVNDRPKSGEGETPVSSASERSGQNVPLVQNRETNV